MLSGVRASLMSDTKWRKLFIALDRTGLELHQARVKFLDDEEVFTITVPRRCSLYPPHTFLDIFEFGPTALRRIEWLEFPRSAVYERPSPNGTGRILEREASQDVEKAKQILERAGRFPLDLTETGLRITGHVRN